MAGTYEVPAVGSSNETQEPKIKTFIESWNSKLDSTNSLEGKNLSLGALGRWYAPVEIATEQERESASFGLLTTPDEVANVVLPKSGIIQIVYRAKAKCSVAAAGRVALFLGATQIKGYNAGTAEANIEGTAEFNQVATTPSALVASGLTGGSTADATTGQGVAQGFASIFAEAGTYKVSVQYRATSGKVAVKERKLWVGVIGV